MIASGGGLPGRSEAHAIHEILLAEGVPDANITLEEHARTTWQNIRFSVPLIEDRSQPVLLITDIYHAPRARLAARREGLVVQSSSPPLTGRNSLKLLRAFAREGLAYLAYAAGIGFSDTHPR